MDDLDLHLALEDLRTNPAAHTYHERITRGMQAIEQGTLTSFERDALHRLLARFPVSTTPSPDPVVALIAAFQRQLPQHDPAAVATAIQHALAQRPATLNGAPVTIRMDGDTHAHQANLAIGNQVGGNLVQVTVTIPIPDARFDALLATALRTHEHEKTLARIHHAAQQIESDRLLNLRLQGFVGRAAELAAIREQIAAMRPTGGYVLIKAAAGEGKSSSIAKLIQEAGITSTPHHFIALTTGREYQLGLLRAVVAQLILKHGLTVSYFPEASYPAMKGEFARILDELSKQCINETIYLDGLDQLQPESDGSRDLSFLPPQPPPGIVIVLGSRPDETLKPLEILHRVDYDLPPLSETDALSLWRSVQPAVADGLLHDLYAALKGNALFIHLAADTMRGQSVVDATSLIQQIEQNPSNLFGITLERIKNRSEHRWPTIWRPMVALLVVTQEPLLLGMIGRLLGQPRAVIQDAVWVMGGLVSQGSDQRVALHHLLFRDYVQVHEFDPDELRHAHQRMADWCAQNVDSIWIDDRDPIEQARRIYARHHYITHLFLAENWPVLWQVLDAGDYGEQKTRFDPSTRLYALDLDRGRESAIKAGRSTDEHIHHLPWLWKYSLLRTSLTSRVDQWPNALFVALAMLGRTHEALERIELLSSADKQIEYWISIHPWCDAQQQRTLILRLDDVCRHLSDSNKKGAIAIIAEGTVSLGQREQALTMLATALSIAQSIDNTFEKHAVLATIANAAATHGAIDQALSIAQSIGDPSYKSKALTTIANTAATHGQREQALAMLTTALSIARSIDDPSNHGHALRTITAATATHGAIDQALSIARSIDDPLHQRYALATIVTAAATHGAIDQALSIARSIDHPSHQHAALATIATAAATHGAIDQAASIARSIDDPFHKSKALATIATAAATHSQPEQALAMLTTALSIAQSIDRPAYKSISLRTIATAAATHGAIDKALPIAQSIDDTFEKSKALATIATAAATHGAIDKAVSIALSIDDTFEKSAALATIATAVAAHGQREQALAMLATALSIAQSIDDTVDKHTALRIIAAATATHGAIDQAVSIALSIDDTFDKHAVLTTIVTAAATHGAIDQAVSIAQSIDDTFHKSKALTTIATAATAHGQPELALAMLTTALSIARSIDHPSRQSDALATIATAATAHGQPEQALAMLTMALSIAQSIDRPFHKSKALITITTPVTAHGQREQALAMITTALSIAQSIDDSFDKRDALITITTAATAHGQPEQALVMLITVLSIAQSIDDSFDKRDALTTIATAATAHGQREQALAMLTTALSIARSIDHPSSYALATIATAAATHGAIDQALSIARSIDHPSRQRDALATIAAAAATHGAIDQALSIAQSIDDTFDKSNALAIIATAAATHGQPEQALAMITTALSIALSMDRPFPKNNALATMAAATATHGAIGQALSIAQAIDDPSHRAETLRIILQKAQSVIDALTSIQHIWFQATRSQDLWTMTDIITPLLKDYSWLGIAILEGEAWVNEQIKRLG